MSEQFSQSVASQHAMVFADQCGLPQTVYRNASSGGWWHTNPLAGLLVNAEVAVTVLPRRYFK